MTNLYFACMDCKIYVDAGYGWACWSLEETGVVKRGNPVSVKSVMAARQYWTPSETESADWLNKEVLPSVRCFLGAHKRHSIVFGNTADFLSYDRDGFLEWMQVGFMPQLLPRYFAEFLGLGTWEEVRGYILKQEATPWWWMLQWDDLHNKARRKFEQIVESRSSSVQTSCCASLKHWIGSTRTCSGQSG
jgi:hypothetical protein